MKKARILIVEDDQIISLEIRERLEEFGYEVVGTEKTGEKAVETATRIIPDLVLMDIHLA